MSYGDHVDSTNRRFPRTVNAILYWTLRSDLRTFQKLIERQLLPACLLILLLIGCNQEPSPTAKTPSDSPPRDGIGQRLGTDVTAQPGRSSIQPSAEQPRIVAFGNSLTAGLGVGSDEAYPAQLQHRLVITSYSIHYTKLYDWISLGKAAKQPVPDLMDGWIFQPGYPLITAELTVDSQLLLNQQRFTYLPHTSLSAPHSSPTTWHVPIQLRIVGREKQETRRHLLTDKEITLRITSYNVCYTKLLRPIEQNPGADLGVSRNNFV